jgi:hypothetical protein
MMTISFKVHTNSALGSRCRNPYSETFAIDITYFRRRVAALKPSGWEPRSCTSTYYNYSELLSYTAKVLSIFYKVLSETVWICCWTTGNTSCLLRSLIQVSRCPYPLKTTRLSCLHGGTLREAVG